VILANVFSLSVFAYSGFELDSDTHWNICQKSGMFRDV